MTQLTISARPALRIAAFTLAAALVGTSPLPAATPSPEDVVDRWRKMSPHPLIGTVVQIRDGQPVTSTVPANDDRPGSALVRGLGLKDAKFVLLGEIHDNPEHHILRAGIIDALTEDGLFGRNTHPPVVTEHIRAEQIPALAAFRKLTAEAVEPPPVQELFNQIGWDKSGWPASGMFAPLYKLIIEARLKIVAGEPSRERIRVISRGGETALGADDRTRLKLDQPLGKPLADALAAELGGSHCGMLPASAIPGMALAQRYRDAYLAVALLAEEQIYGPVVLLAGNGHVRNDRGVPWHIRNLAPGKGTASVVLVEVENGRTDPLSYLPRDPDGRPAADVIIFTPPAVREDPCARMRAQKQKQK